MLETLLRLAGPDSRIDAVSIPAPQPAPAPEGEPIPPETPPDVIPPEIDDPPPIEVPVREPPAVPPSPAWTGSADAAPSVAAAGPGSAPDPS